MVPSPRYRVRPWSRKGSTASAACERPAIISVTMWMSRKPTAPNDTARCTAWAMIRPLGAMTMRSDASRPTPTAAVSPISAKTPA